MRGYTEDVAIMNEHLKRYSGPYQAVIAPHLLQLNVQQAPIILVP